MEAADVVVINTCAIREAAEAKVIGRQGHLNRLKAANPSMRVVMTGCSVRESNRTGLSRRYPAVDLFLRPDEEPELVDRLGLASAQAPVGAVGDDRRHDAREGRARLGRDAPRAGPGRRDRGRRGEPRLGDQRLAADHLRLRQDLHLLHRPVQPRPGAEPPVRRDRRRGPGPGAAGYREVTLLGQNVNSYGHDLAPEPRFAHVHTERDGRAAPGPRRPPRPGRADPLDRRAAGRRRRARDPAAPVRHLAPVGPVRSPGGCAARLPDGVRGAPPAGPVRLGLDAPADGPPVHDRALPRAARGAPRGRARARAVDGRHRRLLRGDRGRVRGHAAAAGDRPLRPGVRRGVQRAARHAGDPHGGRRPRRREAAPAERAARRAGGDRAGAEPRRGSAARPRSSSTPSCRRAATTTTTRRRRAPRSRATRSRTCPTASPTSPGGRARASSSTWPACPRSSASSSGSAWSTAGRTRSGARSPEPRRGTPADAPDDAPAPLIVLGGPTATGKTGLAIELAERLLARGIPSEIVSADSRQVYRGLDIGTAKATPEEQARVVHHGIDLVDPDQPYTVADFRAHALDALRALGGRGGVGILAGGTGFWLRAVTAGIDTDALPHDPALRADLEATLAEEGVEVLAARLQALAPSIAARTDLRNPRRVVRALEIATLRGDGPLPAPLGYGAPILGLQLVVEPAEHRRRIHGVRDSSSTPASSRRPGRCATASIRRCPPSRRSATTRAGRSSMAPGRWTRRSRSTRSTTSSSRSARRRGSDASPRWPWSTRPVIRGRRCSPSSIAGSRRHLSRTMTRPRLAPEPDRMLADPTTSTSTAPRIIDPGTPDPLGATWSPDGVNVSVYAKRATGVDLLLFDTAEDRAPSRVLALSPDTNRTGAYWHALVGGIAPGQLYGYRVSGPWAPERGLRFDPTRVLLDPYGTRRRHPGRLPAGVPRRRPRRPGPDEERRHRPGRLRLGGRPAARPIGSGHDHLRGPRRGLHGGPGLRRRATTGAGRIAGSSRRSRTSSTSASPPSSCCRCSRSTRTPRRPGLINYWGYQPVSFFAPHPAYATNQAGQGPLDEFRDLVKALHRAGLEVILDVVYNHTAEGGAGGPTFSFKGFANEDYYLLGADRSTYVDASGTGNTLNANGTDRPPDDPRQPALLGARDARRRVPVRPRGGAVARRARQPDGEPADAVGHRDRPGPRRHEAHRRGVGRGRPVRGRQLRGRPLGGVERRVPRRRARVRPQRSGQGQGRGARASSAARTSTGRAAGTRRSASTSSPATTGSRSRTSCRTTRSTTRRTARTAATATTRT